MYSRVYVEITNICNMHCSFCHRHSRPMRQMTFAEFSHVLDALKGHTKYLYYHLMGEALLHPELPKFLALANARGFHSMLTTNGTLLADRGDALLAAGVHKVNISLHSFEGTDDASYTRYLQEICAFANTATAAGTIVVLRLWNKGHDGGRNAQTLSFLQAHLPGEWTENNRGLRIREKLFLEWGERFGWPDKDAPVQGEQVFCHGLRDHFGILSDGTIVPCCLDSDGIIALGNVFKASITEILSSGRATAMVDGFSCRTATEELCTRCAYAQRFS